ncbi:hypothetical protein K466DRAFT_87040 [Polyporus arcularius HHB13444]|uniref:Uncharacterized protein n=1 Tax=Polyporus arcularius HHB13444 TaxID=1314778 RepID=A0A5C3PEC9_9APHY|nr:hypothetical protein K466DRAFT_87040 [Polyporus arcularius HHB13444]
MARAVRLRSGGRFSTIIRYDSCESRRRRRRGQRIGVGESVRCAYRHAPELTSTRPSRKTHVRRVFQVGPLSLRRRESECALVFGRGFTTERWAEMDVLGGRTRRGGRRWGKTAWRELVGSAWRRDTKRRGKQQREETIGRVCRRLRLGWPPARSVLASIRTAGRYPDRRTQGRGVLDGGRLGSWLGTGVLLAWQAWPCMAAGWCWSGGVSGAGELD